MTITKLKPSPRQQSLSKKIVSRQTKQRNTNLLIYQSASCHTEHSGTIQQDNSNIIGAKAQITT